MEKKKINSLVISESNSIKSVLLHLQKTKVLSPKFCLVKNKKNQIVDVITDGDIRRILLKSRDLNEKISKYLKKKFVFSDNQRSDANNKKILNKKKINFLPILDKRKRLIDIIFSNQIKKINNEVIIMAGGRGKRMFPLTENTPKPLLNVGGLPLIGSIINRFKDQGFYNFTISTNYLSKKIEKYFSNIEKGININFIKEKKKLGTAGALSLFKPRNSNPFICINGDIYTNLDFNSLIEYHKKNNYFCTVCTRNYNFQIPFGVINQSKEEIISEKPTIKKEISAGIYVFNNKALRHLKKNKYIDMNDMINLIGKRKKKVGLFHVYELVFDIGDIKTYEEVNSYLNNQ